MAQVKIQLGSKEYNKAWIDSLSSTTQLTSDGASVNYGILPNTGNAQMKDINGQIRADIDNDMLPISNVQTKITVNGNQIQEHITSNSDYNIIDKKLDLSFSDRLSLLDSVTYSGMALKEHSMTAYEMLDDVIGSYGGYAKERPINWVKYQHASSISTQSKSTTITATTDIGWAIIGTPLKVVPNQKCALSYSISTDTAYTEHMGQGIIVQVLKSTPTDSDCASLAIAYAFLSKEVADNIGIIEFTPTTDTVYFVINFGWASSGQTISLTVNSLKVDGNSLSTSTTHNKFLEPSASATYTSYFIKSRTSTIGDYLDKITIDYPYLPSASYRETIEKFCNLAQITGALDSYGVFQFYDARPCYREEEVIDVPKSYQISNLQKTLLLKNKYNGVDIKQKAVKDETIVASNIYNWNSVGQDYTTNKDTATATDAEISITYFIGDIKIPKNNKDNLEQIKHISDIKFACTGIHSSGTVSKVWGDDGTSGYQFNYTSSEEETWVIDKFSITNASGSATATLENKFSLSIDDKGEYWQVSFTIPANETYWYYELYAGNTRSDLQNYDTHKLEVSIYGNKRVVSFEEVDLSSPNIANATTIVSVPTNELMQKSENVIGIRDNILYDYEKGVPTATIDLFCGLKDWDNGEIINKGDIIKFADDVDKNGDENLWRVTGRTFEYKGAPKLSLELQRQKCWHTIWTGSAKAENISNGDFTTSGTKYGAISLPISVDTSMTTAFVANVAFIRDGKTVVRTACGIANASASVLLTGTTTSIMCFLLINKDGNQISYSADEVYKKVLTTVHKGYVQSIYITRIEQFY